MLMEVKNQLRVNFLTIKYAVMRELLNKVTFFTNVTFMILNNATFIIQWLVLFSIREEMGGYTLKQVLLLWGFASFTYGFSHFFFKKSYELHDIINNGKLDAFLVLPKNVLLQAITSDVEPSGLGDIIYGYIVLGIYGITFRNFILFTLLGIMGGICLTAIAVITSSLSFWFRKTDVIADTANSLMTNFATYPDGIFKGVVKYLLYTLVPVGMTAYIPVKLMIEFKVEYLLIVLVFTLSLLVLSFVIFNLGLKKYSSSNLMVARI